MGSTVGVRYKASKVVATNAVLAIRSVGFKPRKVVITNETTLARAEWNEAMADAYAVVTALAGDLSIVTSAGITPLDGSGDDPPGFSIGALATINDTTTEVLCWEAWG